MTSARKPEAFIHGKALRPESLMSSYGYDPKLSEGSLKIPIFQTIQIHDPKPPDTYAAIKQEQGKVSPAATALAGAIAGALVGGGLVASRSLGDKGKTGSADGEE